MDVKKIKLHLAIRSLNIGGAERQFITLVKNIDKNRFDITVSSMYGGVQEELIKTLENVRYYNLNKKGRYDIVEFYTKYKKLLKEISPDVIYSFKEEMNVFSFLCKSKHTKIIWGFRASNMDLKKYAKASQILFWLQKFFSSNVDMIISNSNASIEYHKNNGYLMNKAIVIPNGIDTDKFKRNELHREEFRKKYNLKSTDIAVGIVARIDFMKGYLIFSQVAKNILDKYQNIYFFSIGSGDKNLKNECQNILEKNPRFIWLGHQTNVEEIYSALDISSSPSSFGEGFSNSIAEAMSCNLPCVVTEVGDSALIVGKYGVLTKADNVKDFQNGLEWLIKSSYEDSSTKYRQRIVENFSIATMVANTQQAIVEVINEK